MVVPEPRLTVRRLAEAAREERLSDPLAAIRRSSYKLIQKSVLEQYVELAARQHESVVL